MSDWDQNIPGVPPPPSSRGRLYMRKWQVLIYKPAYTEETYPVGEGGSVTYKIRDQEHDTAVDVSALRCVFKTDSKSLTYVSVCTLQVYNMNAATEGEIIREGFQISISAGYQEGQYGEIFTGDIVQVIRNRENGVDYKLEIIALRGSTALDLNHIRCTIAAKSSPREVVKAIAANARAPFEVGELSENLSGQQLARGKVFFGAPRDYLRDVAVGNKAYFWMGEDDKLVVKKTVDEIPSDQVLVLTPDTGLVGTPQYSDDGIHIQMLMDPRVKMMSMIKIDNEIIRRQLLNLNLNGQGGNNLAQQSQFDQDGEYQVFSISHHGDTYGDDWITEVVAVSRTGRSGLTAGEESETKSSQ